MMKSPRPVPATVLTLRARENRSNKCAWASAEMPTPWSCTRRLELAGLAPPSPGIRGLNQYRFNGKEFQADLGLNWNHQDWRFLDPQILRWHAVDPLIEIGQESWSPYAFGYDNAVRYADADGRAPGDGDGPTPLGTAVSYATGFAAAYVDNATGLNFRGLFHNIPNPAAFNEGQDGGGQGGHRGRGGRGGGRYTR